MLNAGASSFNPESTPFFAPPRGAPSAGAVNLAPMLFGHLPGAASRAQTTAAEKAELERQLRVFEQKPAADESRREKATDARITLGQHSSA